MDNSAKEEPQSHDDGEHSPFLAHHFESQRQQFDAGKLGMWIFLVTEILLFGGLFCAYAVFRSHHPEIFVYAAEEFLDKTLGAINTGVLIFSSFTMAWAVRCAQLNQRQNLIRLLAITVVCGFGFLGIKYVEYRHKWHEGLLWARQYSPTEHGHGEESAGADPEHAEPSQTTTTETGDTPGTHRDTAEKQGPAEDASPAQPDEPDGGDSGQSTESGQAEEAADQAAPPLAMASEGQGAELAKESESSEPATERSSQVVTTLPDTDRGQAAPRFRTEPKQVGVFFSIYFIMTGLHALHVIAGMGAIIWVLRRSIKGHFSSTYFGPVDYVGLYWHLVDLVWIYLFPLLYLID